MYGMCPGRIRDKPAVKELIERIMVEAGDTIDWLDELWGKKAPR